jgi:hypothetical protein
VATNQSAPKYPTWLKIGCALPLIIFLSLFLISDARYFLKWPKGQIQELDLPLGNYLAVAWGDEDKLIVTHRPAESIKWEHHFWQVSLPAGSMQPLSWPDGEDCRSRRWELPQWLPDGRFGYLLRCIRDDFRDSVYLMAYNPHNLQAERLKSFQVVDIYTRDGTFSWEPNMEHVLVTSGMSEGLAFDVEVHYLNAPYQSIRNQLRGEGGAAYSPDGTKIALFAIRQPTLVALWQAMSAEPTGRRHLILMLPDGSIKETLLTGVEGFAVPVWSPDGEWLAFGATLGRFVKTEGLWMINVSTGKLYLVAKGHFERPGWSADGTKIAALHLTGDNSGLPDDIVIADVSTVR